MGKRGRKFNKQNYTQIGTKWYNVQLLMSKVQEDDQGHHLWVGPKHRQGYGMVGGYKIATRTK